MSIFFRTRRVNFNNVIPLILLSKPFFLPSFVSLINALNNNLAQSRLKSDNIPKRARQSHINTHQIVYKVPIFRINVILHLLYLNCDHF